MEKLYSSFLRPVFSQFEDKTDTKVKYRCVKEVLEFHKTSLKIFQDARVHWTASDPFLAIDAYLRYVPSVSEIYINYANNYEAIMNSFKEATEKLHPTFSADNLLGVHSALTMPVQVRTRYAI